jgi:hypothetical protein
MSKTVKYYFTVSSLLFTISSAFVGNKQSDNLKMHGSTIKIIYVQQAKLNNSYKNTKLRSWLIFYCFRHFKLNKINIKCICW